MKKKLSGFLLLLFCLMSANRVLAEGPTVLVRPQIGIGVASAGDPEFTGSYAHLGTRLLLNATDIRRYGLELTYLKKLNSERKTDFSVIGIVLEQRLHQWFNMSIGTVGYIGMQKQSGNPFGLLTNLGYESNHPRFRNAFITYRSEFVFERTPVIINSLSLGMGF